MAKGKKRKHPRTPAKGLSVLLPGVGGVIPCSAEDISLGGVFIRTNEQYLPGTKLGITLLRSGMSKGLKVQSTVTNLRTPGPDRHGGVGVRFEALSDETRTRLAKLLADFGVENPEAEEEDAHLAVPAPAPEVGSRFTLGRPFLSSEERIDSDPDAYAHSDLSRTLERPAAEAKVPPPLWSREGRSSAHDLAPDLMDRLGAQIRGLLLQLGAADQRLASRDSELVALRQRVAELESALGKRDLELAQLRAGLAR
ncbi:MAG: PilZ domain-containing protein [Myxococcota bacterium]|nr:PilZ domain-containing protein [Myxococcota bacterium]